MNVRRGGAVLPVDLHDRPQHDEVPVGAALGDALAAARYERSSMHAEETRGAAAAGRLVGWVTSRGWCAPEMLHVDAARNGMNIGVLRALCPLYNWPPVNMTWPGPSTPAPAFQLRRRALERRDSSMQS